VVVAPLASGSMYTKLARGFGELGEVGLVDPPAIRYVGGQPAGCAPIATAFANDTDIIAPIERPDTIVRSLAIGNPADGGYAVRLATATDGAIHEVGDALTVDSIRLLAETEGILTETAGGVTLGALRLAIERGTVRRDDEVVLLITGNGLKTLDVLDWTQEQSRPIPPTFDAFEAWWSEREAIAA
jgi:threonine synthase